MVDKSFPKTLTRGTICVSPDTTEFIGLGMQLTMYPINRTIHAIKPEIVVRFRNHAKTVALPADTLKYTRHARAAVNMTAK